MLLNFELLEFREFGAPSLQVQSAAALVDLAIICRAHQERHKSRRIYLDSERISKFTNTKSTKQSHSYRLISFSTALVTSICSHLHHRLDFGTSRHNTPDCHKLACSTDWK